MNTTALVWDPSLARYELSPEHPLKPVRLVLAVELIRAYNLLAEESEAGEPSGSSRTTEPSGAPTADILAPRPATDDELLLVHDREYLDAVRRASADPASFIPSHGLGTADDPVFEGMHEVSAEIVGGGIEGLRVVLGERYRRTFNVAGGLHHAQRDRASGFCVYNDPAVAIASAIAERPDLRVAYLDIDAHHGDGVEAAFYDTDRVLTISLHESGRYLFPGTGFTEDTGRGAGVGYALNVPMPPLADDDCYRHAFEMVVSPALRAYRPDVVVAQLGCDAHHEDPLTHLGQTLRGYRGLVRSTIALADELCGGRIAACGGGGYGVLRTVPRAWTCAMAELLGVEIPEEIPERWRELVRRATGLEAPRMLTADDEFELSPPRAAKVRAETDAVVDALRSEHPLLQKALASAGASLGE